MPFFNTNVAEGLTRGGRFQVGRNNIDDGFIAESGISLPQMPNPQASYVYYNCTIGVMLDSGIAVHNRLPQTLSPISDTLAVVPLDHPALDTLTGFGVNLRCKDQYTDIIQRMGHSRYWFRLWGQALRVGYQVPIPGIKSIGGVPAIPYDKNPQWAYNTISPGGNYSGSILWRAQWSLWYTTQIPPSFGAIGSIVGGAAVEGYKMSNPGAHISGSTQSGPPTNLQTPYSQPDDNALPSRS